MIRNIIIKAALDCNISCKYCYVKHNRQYDTTNHVMKVDTLQVIMEKIGEYLKQSPKVDRLTLYWHGGEPLLCGKEFFQQSYLFQKKYFPSGVSVANTIQTNGTLLDLDWLNLIKKINYDICLSLDGPAEINDMWRQTRDGKGTYGQVVRAIELLKSQGFPVSLLSVVTPEALPHGRMIYRHLRELGATWIDFMYPFYSKIDNTIAQTVEP
ncbi:MAG: radical SAM protein, partial [Methanocella sp.]